MYEVRLTEKAAKQIRKLSEEVRTPVLEAIAGLRDNPRPRGYSRVKKRKDVYRIRVSEYRIFYTIDDKGKLVIVAALYHRGKAYTKVARLNT